MTMTSNLGAEYDEWSASLGEPNPFEACHVEGLADAAWLLRRQRRKIEARIKHLEDIVLAHCIKTGEVVRGKKAPLCFAEEYLDDVKQGVPSWKTRLRFARTAEQHERFTKTMLSLVPSDADTPDGTT